MKQSQNTKWGDKETRRQDIMQAAETLLLEKGYSDLSIRDVAKKADISPGLLYSYFANKEELFALLYANRLALFNNEICEICESVESMEQLFMELLHAYLPMYKTYGKEFNVFSLMRNSENFPQMLTDQLTQNAIKLMMTLQQHFYRLAHNENLDVSKLQNQQLILPMFWIVLNGLAEHYSGERQSLYQHDSNVMAQFLFNTLVSGLYQGTQ